MVVLTLEHTFEKIAGNRVTVFKDEEVENAESSVEFPIDSVEVARKIVSCTNNLEDAFTIVNLSTVYNQLVEWQNELPQVKPFYAVKCNNDLVLLKTLSTLGVGFDCASRGEIDLILGNELAGSEGIIYANPCKTRSYIRHAEKCGIRKMTFDSLEELTKIKEYHSSPKLILRINITDETAQCQFGAKFGCDPLHEAPKLIMAAKDMDLELIGISFHVGSGCNDPTAFTRAIFAASNLFKIGKDAGHNMYLLDIGGGFPGQDSNKITFNQIAKVIRRALNDFFPIKSDMTSEFKSDKLEIIAEPGRFFASAAVSLCANIIGKSQVPASRITKRTENDYETGFMYYINDGVYGSFNCILFDHFQPRGVPLFATENPDKLFSTTIWGPTCDSLDQVENDTKMAEVYVGDWLYYPQMGAYTSVAASQFNGFSTPEAYYIIDERTWKATFGSQPQKLIEGVKKTSLNIF